MGSDDKLLPNAIEIYSDYLNNNYDLITANIIFREKIKTIKGGPLWLHGPQNVIVSHSIGCVINKKLHNKFGLYSIDLPIAADTFFLLKAIKGKSKVFFCNQVVGIYGSQGVSNKKYYRMTYEHMLAHYKTGSNLFLQIILMIIKQLIFIFKYKILAK